MILLHSLIIYKPAHSHDYSHAAARRACASWDRSARTCAALRTIAADHPAHESRQDVIRGTVDSLVKLVDTLAGAGIEFDRRTRDLKRWRPRRSARGAEPQTSELTMSAQPANETGGRL